MRISTMHTKQIRPTSRESRSLPVMKPLKIRLVCLTASITAMLNLLFLLTARKSLRH